MSNSKKIFIALAVLFFMGLGYMGYDIATRTTFPGAKSQPKERAKSQFMVPDSLLRDTLKGIQR